MSSEKKRLLLGILAVVVVAALAIGGTLAFLTDSETVTNTFTVGDIDIELDEPEYPDPEPRDNVPGTSYPKDPTVTALKGDSYVRLKVEFLDWDQEEDETAPITDPARLAKIWQTLYFANAGEAEAVNGGDAYDWFKGLGDGTDDLVANAAFKYALSELTLPACDPAALHFNSTQFTKDGDRSNKAADTEGTRGPNIEYFNYINAAGVPVNVLFEGDSAVLFDSVIIPTGWNQTDLAILGSYKIVITAQAIQAQNFANATEAFTALDGEITAGTIQENYVAP